ncbi:hypothetical protein ACFL9T_13300 [Thermodesulfobacteriota bacterium]
MDRDKKAGLRRKARETEMRLAQSLLRWRHKKERKELPEEQIIQKQSEVVVEQTHRIIARRGKNVLNEFKSLWDRYK